MQRATLYARTIEQPNRNTEYNGHSCGKAISHSGNYEYNKNKKVVNCAYCNKQRWYHEWSFIENLKEPNKSTQCGRPNTKLCSHATYYGIAGYRNTCPIAGCSGDYTTPAVIKLSNFNFEELGDGYRISANKDYELQGKITLPIKYKEKYITEIGDFTSILTTATHVFFINKNDGDISRYTTVGTRAFGGEDNNEYTLIGIYLPNTITTFNSYAFQYLSSLKDISENAINNEYKLPNSLITINSYACRKTSLRLTTLSNCLQLDTIGMHGMSSCGTDVTFNAFPDSLTTIGSSALAHLEAINITSTNAIIKIGSLGLYNSSKKTTQLTLEQPLTEIGAEAFHLFGQRNNLQVTNNSKISDIEPYFTNMITNSSLIGGN